MTTSLAPAAPVRDSAYRISEILSALSCALDITEGQPPGHAVRTCLIGMRLADRVGVPIEDRGALFYALLLKDLGCSSNAARLCSLFGADDRALKREHKLTDWSRPARSLAYALRHAVPEPRRWGASLRVASMAVARRAAAREMVQTRCDRGADIAAMLGFSGATREAIRTLDEHWDGSGMPEGLARPRRSRCWGASSGLAQTVEVFASTFGVEAAVEMAMERRGRWFDPLLVDALRSFAREEEFWARCWAARRSGTSARSSRRTRSCWRTRAAGRHRPGIRPGDRREVALHLSPLGAGGGAGGDDRPAAALQCPELRDLRRAGLLHDIGKLGVSTLILDKPDRLTERERAEVRVHPAYTQRILERVAAFARDRAGGGLAPRAAGREGVSPRPHGGPALADEPRAGGGRRLRGADRRPALSPRAAAKRGGRDPRRPVGHRALHRVGRGAGLGAGLGSPGAIAATACSTAAADGAVPWPIRELPPPRPPTCSSADLQRRPGIASAIGRGGHEERRRALRRSHEHGPRHAADRLRQRPQPLDRPRSSRTTTHRSPPHPAPRRRRGRGAGAARLSSSSRARPRP